MKTRSYLLIAPLLVLAAARLSPPARSIVPESLTNEQFWSLTTSLSEPGGFFRSDNLVSNEDAFQDVIADLERTVKRGGVYLGVGPDQNFTYLAALQPGLAFITDIRRGNLHMQLMYKALFELSADRGEFVSRLFTKPRPSTVTTASTVT